MLFFLRAITVLLAAKSLSSYSLLGQEWFLKERAAHRPGNFISFFPKYFVMTGSSRF